MCCGRNNITKLKSHNLRYRVLQITRGMEVIPWFSSPYEKQHSEAFKRVPRDPGQVQQGWWVLYGQNSNFN